MIAHGSIIECTLEQREVMDAIDHLTQRQRQKAIKVILRIRNSRKFAARVRANPAIIVHMIADTIGTESKGEPT